jgi:hypothetical protein
MVLLTYVDDCIIISPSKESINHLILSMQSGPENFKLTDEGDVNKIWALKSRASTTTLSNYLSLS